ncbi:MAG: carbamoyl-phosphate synthase large subunit [Betaproteobacteria bacterium AqS2]|uniref:Carbamoyl phosphate synthase large chain n=1 Tax=Candidatus Amphirhobacter heronislandensis TaxID=1732024 RepID=A0A930Y0Q1_9GAMM|nr:carbamoyl-phosphate synthase large subunit [Betaproteobacteria bacterium AqS2]
MPRNPDIGSVLLIGAGPIVIGQACEFDYSGSQACRALKEEGVRVVLLNSNPATIMTDPQMADATYVEPIDAATAARIIKAEKVDAVLPTMGGQTALNCAMRLHADGACGRGGVRLIGADFKAIHAAEDREEFRRLMDSIGVATARGRYATSLEEALAAGRELDTYPLIVRPSFTLGGTGGGIAYNYEEFAAICASGLALSANSSLLIEESMIGWKEYELEVIRDRNDNCIVVCGIENIDPLGVHTGDSVTVAPILTLTDKEYQAMRDAAFRIIRAIGVETGGANVQFAVDPATGRQIVIEMNPRVSRSSALASKATGFPIAKVATKLALGYTLDELSNEITGGRTPASFEPALDYVVVKIPRFNFDKFPGTAPELGTQMKAVGEAMAIGRSFPEALQKALCSLETGLAGLDSKGHSSLEAVLAELRVFTPDSLLLAADALRLGATVERLHEVTGIDPWFLHEIARLIEREKELAALSLPKLGREAMLAAKRDGFSDRMLARLLRSTEKKVRTRRARLGVHASFHRVDSCAAEFPTATAYQYSTYGEACESAPTRRKSYAILGSGPNRIGQGIEFDYCCIHASLALRDHGFETIMVNCNPETVSTDYDVSDRLYFEPLTTEHVLEILRVEKPAGVIVHTGGQTPLAIAAELEEAGARIIGTPVAAIHRTEDRREFSRLLRKCGLRQPSNATASSGAEALRLAGGIGYPLVVRPSYVLGGQAMKIIYSRAELQAWLRGCDRAVLRRGVLLDRFLTQAVEVDVDAVSDGKEVVVAGVLEHVERAGVHSGDSSCALPPLSLSAAQIAELERQAVVMAREVGAVGFMNIQFAIQGDAISVLEINPRASRTVPFIAKATGWPVARIATLAMAGVSLARQGARKAAAPNGCFIKEAVFPFSRMPGADTLLGPEMKSTGEAMGIGDTHASAFLRATEAIFAIPADGAVLISVRDPDKAEALEIARRLHGCGFAIVATSGTAAYFAANDGSFPVETVRKVNERKPTVVDAIKSGKVKMVINTVTAEGGAPADSLAIRRAALHGQLLYYTTIEGARAIADGICERREGDGGRMLPIQRRHLPAA